ncbi:MAG TPA: ABC transporter permease [Steroidobacteraceae bacterium]|nr:ABC transporter permease [Steroidobacteraceae bacterium]
MTRRLLAVLHARNLEFLRDRATLGWNVLLPVVLVIAMGLIFGGPERPLFKVAVLQSGASIETTQHPFLRTHYVEFFKAKSEADAVKKVARHQIDLLLDLRGAPRYWVNTDSPKGYIAEKLLLESDPTGAQREAVSGQAVRYIDWLLPGILGMNMMFSCLFGVGWVVVRYRKSGFLKRLRATPLRAIEFISAQVLSRLILIMVVTVLVFAALQLVLHFRMEGNPLLLFAVALLGAISLIAIGLFVAARFTSEELAGGILNFITWPMMLLSGVWFSLEGSAEWLQWMARIFPLTQMLEAARAIMLDGAGLAEVAPQLAFLALSSVLFLSLGALFFRWRAD